MKIGIISDTHGQVDLALAASREFIFRAVDAVIHCGDIGSDMVLTEMAALFDALDIPIYAVLGNCDIQHEMDYFEEVPGVNLMGRVAHLTLANRKIAVLHSDDEAHFEALVQSNTYDYVFFGHSHTRRNDQIERTRVVNPGSAGRGMHPSCAIVNLVEDDVTFFTIRRPE
ncbi:MAG: YfcE family phosphodiesterase [Kiritimatiellales bacterium]|nr:YfcE family phosphodiesterase [Kiritimatiellales bacterium]